MRAAPVDTIRWTKGTLAAWALLLAAVGSARAEDLSRVIPNLFGGSLGTTIDQNAVSKSSQEPELARRFRDLPAVLAAARSQVPAPSSTGAFRFAWDTDLDTFVRSDQSLGPSIAERATTLGKGVLTVGFAYTFSDFDTLENDNLSNLEFSQPALSDDYVAGLPPGDQEAFGDDLILTNLDLSFRLNQFYVSAAYGLTDDIDVSLALAINRIDMRGRATARIEDVEENGNVFFGTDQEGVIRSSEVPACSQGLVCVEDSFDESATGTGDIYLRGKWHFAETRWADVAVAAVLTIPTGNSDDLLGFRNPTFTPWLISSTNIGPLSPHVNLGYAIRSGYDGSQFQWIAGADLRAAAWLTLGADFLGYHDNDRDGSNDDVIQSALAIKINPIDQFVLGVGFQLPLNRDGLRADVIYSGQIEYTF